MSPVRLRPTGIFLVFFLFTPPHPTLDLQLFHFFFFCISTQLSLNSLSNQTQLYVIKLVFPYAEVSPVQLCCLCVGLVSQASPKEPTVRLLGIWKGSSYRIMVKIWRLGLVK